MLTLVTVLMMVLALSVCHSSLDGSSSEEQVIDMENTYQDPDWHNQLRDAEHLSLWDRFEDLSMENVRTSSERDDINHKKIQNLYPIKGKRREKPQNPYVQDEKDGKRQNLYQYGKRGERKQNPYPLGKREENRLNLYAHDKKAEKRQNPYLKSKKTGKRQNPYRANIREELRQNPYTLRKREEKRQNPYGKKKRWGKQSSESVASWKKSAEHIKMINDNEHKRQNPYQAKQGNWRYI